MVQNWGQQRDWQKGFHLGKCWVIHLVMHLVLGLGCCLNWHWVMLRGYHLGTHWVNH